MVETGNDNAPKGNDNAPKGNAPKARKKQVVKGGDEGSEISAEM